MILSRRSLLASLGLALPAVIAASAAKASTMRHAPHHSGRHLHASSHLPHHHKSHRTAAVAQPLPQA